MTTPTETQTIILSAGSRRPDNLALPLPAGLVGAAAKMTVGKMMDRGWLMEVEANLRRGEPLWRETGDGHGTTLVVTEAGLLAIGIDPVVAQTMTAIRGRAAQAGEVADLTVVPDVAPPRNGTKQALLIEMLQRAAGATMDEIIAATGWQAHTARGAMSGALKKKRGLTVTSAKEGARGRVYRIAAEG